MDRSTWKPFLCYISGIYCCTEPLKSLYLKKNTYVFLGEDSPGMRSCYRLELHLQDVNIKAVLGAMLKAGPTAQGWQWP